MRLLLTAGRVRSVIADVMTEKDLELALRARKIPYHYDTSAGFLALRIPARTGPLLVYRTASRSAPFAVRPVASVPVLAAPRLPLQD